MEDLNDLLVENKKLRDRLTDMESQRDEARALSDMWESAYAHAMDTDGYVELPKDSMGAYIHVGDMLRSTTGKTYKADVLELHAKGWTACEYATGTHMQWLERWAIERPDSWERIIEDALDGYHDTDFEKLVARCKALCERTKEVGE